MAGRRALPAAALAAAVVTAVAALAIAAGSSGGAAGAWVERASAVLGARLGLAGAALPFGYAFAAGMLAAVNPCGFALVPAYVGTCLWAGGPAARWRVVLRALRLSGAVTAGFVILFAAAGVLLAGAGALILPSLPWLGLVVGVMLVSAGAVALVGGPAPSLRAGEGLAGLLGGAAARPGLAGHVTYGVAYGLASLGCALPVFLAVVGGAMTRGLPVAAGLFVLYGLGLGAVLSAVAVVAAAMGTAVVARLSRVRRLVPAASAALLLLAGAYVTYYWLTIGGVLVRLAT